MEADDLEMKLIELYFLYSACFSYDFYWKKAK